MTRLAKIISGGQTGVDRAALDAAIALEIPHGGWCPRGRLAEDGPIPARYALRQTPTSRYPERTEKNVIDSDATLILCHGKPVGGTLLTAELAKRHKKPFLLANLDKPPEATIDDVRQWLAAHAVETLNVAGPRESQRQGIYQESLELLTRIVRR